LPLTLVTGRANTGKTGVLHGALRKALEDGLPVTLLLPTMPDVRRAEAELGRTGLVGAKVAVLDAWIDELWTLYGDGRRVVTPGARRVLLRRALDSVKLDALAASAATPGFVRLLADVAKRLVRVPRERGKGVDAEAARILRRYHELAAGAGMIERQVAACALAGDPPPVRGPVLVNRFTDLSEAQEALLVGLAKRTEVVVALTWEPDLPATTALDPIVERMFADAQVVPRVTVPEDSELGRIEERLYCPGAPIVPEGRLEIGLAAGDEAECVLAAQAARSLVEEGFAPERVAVVFRDCGRRLGLLTAALAAEGVGADIDVSVPVSSTPLGAVFAALLGACMSPSREQLLALLLSPYADADPLAVADIDARWRRHRVTGSRLLCDASALGPLTGRALAAASRAAKGLDTSTASEWNTAANTLLAAGCTSRSPGSSEMALDAAVHRALLGAIDECLSVEGARLNARDALEFLAVATVASGPAERPGAVQVTEAHRLRSRRFDAIVLGGLTADEFSAERPEPLDAELALRLGAAPGMPERDAERMLFYLVASRARSKLVLLRQESDARGAAKRPSVFWDEVVDLYVDGVALGDVAPQWPPGIEPRRLGLADLADAAPAYAPGRRIERAKAARLGGASRRRGRLRDERVLEALSATSEFSVTELETYMSCPYRWFYDSAVRPRRLDTEVDARERGSRAHRLLTAFYASLEAELGIPRVVPERLDDSLALLARIEEELEETMTTHAVGLREELAVSQAREWARAVVRDDADLLPGFKPIEHEFAFGASAGRPFAVGGVQLRGSIDRIDSGPPGLVITDYKSDPQPKGHGSFAGHGLIQLPVYAAAASAGLGLPVAAGVYRSLRSLAARGFRLPQVDLGGRGSARDEIGQEAVDVLLAEAADGVASAAGGIRDGVIAARPSSKASCTWCGARPFCAEGR
jgi:hypothetical protein